MEKTRRDNEQKRAWMDGDEMLDENFNKWLLVVFCVVEVPYVKQARRTRKGPRSFSALLLMHVWYIKSTTRAGHNTTLTTWCLLNFQQKLYTSLR